MIKRLLNAEYNILFLKQARKFSYLSFTLVILALVLLYNKGLNKGIDFSGGILIEARFEQAISFDELRVRLDDLNLGDIQLQNIADSNDVIIRVGTGGEEEKKSLKKIAILKLFLQKNYANISFRKVDFVGPIVGGELIKSAIIALILSFAVISLYICIRFNLYYGIGALIALIHDVILTIGFYSLTGLEFNLTSIAAILTIIGYSINDSVVVYDRIRENSRKYRSKEISFVINKSLNQILNRTLLTSLTTIMALVALGLFGGEILKSFSLGVLFGVVIGTYSSIYIASNFVNNNNLKKIK